MKNKFIKFGLILFLSFLLCELTLRLFFRFSNQDILAYGCIERLLYQRHPFLEYTLRPGVEINYSDMRLRINSLGFRGKEFDSEDTRPFRVFVLGGSAVFNKLEKDNLPFCEVLDEKLKVKYPERNIEIVNAGVSGYTTFHSLVNLSTRLLDYHPDAMIIYQSWNDIKAWPYLNRKSNYGQMWQELHFRLETLTALKTLASESYTYLAIKALHRVFVSENENKRESIRRLLNKILTPNEGNDTNYGESVYRRNIENIIAVAQKNSVQVLLINPLTLVRSRNSEEEKRRIASEFVHVPEEELPQLVNEAGSILAEVALVSDVTYIDLNKHIQQNQVNLMDHIHLTPQGNRLIADYIAEHWDEIWDSP